jgi:hypothetical protein
MVGIGLVLLSDLFEDYIWSASDVEVGLGLKILGLIPQMKVKDRKSMARVCDQKPNSLTSEAFAGIRGVITSVYRKSQTQSLLVTSSAPKEGKTICSCNLAIMYAKSGDRTLLVDLDLRIPRLRAIFDLPDDGENLLAVLGRKDRKAFDRLPVKSGIENLDASSSTGPPPTTTRSSSIRRRSAPSATRACWRTWSTASCSWRASARAARGPSVAPWGTSMTVARGSSDSS